MKSVEEDYHRLQSLLDCIIGTYADVAMGNEKYREPHLEYVAQLRYEHQTDLKKAAQKYLSHLEGHYHYKTSSNQRKQNIELDALRSFINKGVFPDLPMFKSDLEKYLETNRNLPYRIIDLIRFTLWPNDCPKEHPREITAKEWNDMSLKDQCIIQELVKKFPELQANIEIDVFEDEEDEE